uniref:(northern house mosquito) hypothetical protein n=1 Tax=Culex pipiens TaxID=7175 RepID=A0A8D8PDY5_CULPI
MLPTTLSALPILAVALLLLLEESSGAGGSQYQRRNFKLLRSNLTFYAITFHCSDPNPSTEASDTEEWSGMSDAVLSERSGESAPTEQDDPVHVLQRVLPGR